MRKFAIVLALGAALAVSGCTWKTTGGTAPAPDSKKVAEIIGKVQDATTKICKFVPTATTVANILGALGVGDYSQLTGVAQQICDAVVKKSMIRANAPRPKVAGVPVKGRFVK